MCFCFYFPRLPLAPSAPSSPPFGQCNWLSFVFDVLCYLGLLQFAIFFHFSHGVMLIFSGLQICCPTFLGHICTYICTYISFFHFISFLYFVFFSIFSVLLLYILDFLFRRRCFFARFNLEHLLSFHFIGWLSFILPYIWFCLVFWDLM